MEPEYRLDALLSERPRRGVFAGPPADDELAPLLAAADQFAGLRAATPDPDFARALQARVLARADSLRTAQMPTAAQTQAERSSIERSSTERTRTAGWSTARTAAPAPIGRAGRATPDRPRMPRMFWPGLAAAAILVLVFGTYSVAAHAGPESPLYFVHRVEQNVQVQVASSQADRTRLHLQYANEALAALDRAASAHNDGAYNTALATLLSEAAAASDALTSVPAGSDHDTLAAQIGALRSSMRQELAGDLSSIDWQNRLSTTSALGDLGVAVPRVGAVAVVRQGGNGSGDNGGSDASGDTEKGGGSNGSGSGSPVDQVIVNGGGFAPGATLVVDGHAPAKVLTITVTPTRLVALVQDENVEHAHHIGVSNPDGTAAQSASGPSVQGGPGDGGDGKRPTVTPTHGTPSHGTPTPTRTPGGDDEHGGGHGG